MGGSQQQRRQRLLAQIHKRLERFGASRDPAAVLAPEALAELTALLELVPDPAADIELAHLAGWLHWYRYLVLDPGDDQQDLASALAFFAPVHHMRPDRVPDEVRAYFDGPAPSGDPQALADRAVALLQAALHTSDANDLDTGIDLLRQAVAATPAGHPDRAKYLSNLGAARGLRFDRTGDPDDLDAAIDLLGQAVAATPVGHPSRPGRLSNLAASTEARSKRTGDGDDLDTAIDLLGQAVAASPADHPGRATMLANLGTSQRYRYEQVGDQSDLDAAIDLLGQAVAACPADHPDRSLYLSNLGAARQTRFDRIGDRRDLDGAIDAGRQALAASSPGHPEYAGYLSNLSLALRSRFEQAGELSDLDAAIDAGQQTLAATPPGHPNHAAMLSNLAAALNTRFKQTGDRGYLDAAIGLLGQAVAATPADHPDHAGYSSDLSLVLLARFEQDRDPNDLDGAIAAGRQAVAVKTASPRVRARAARRWAHAAASGQRWQEAVAGSAAAAELLGLIAPPSLTRGDQEHLLGQLGGLGADAAACCVRAGLAERAVELFEQGRGVLLGQALDTRTDLTDLTGKHPALAAKFTALRDDLDKAGPPAGSPSGRDETTADAQAETAQLDTDRRRATAAAFYEVITEIRQLSDFARFLLPPSAAELIAAAELGPVVAVTVSQFGSYALILADGDVLDPVPLPGLTPSEVDRRVAAFVGTLDGDAFPVAGPDGRAAAEQRLGDTLGWLWDVLAGPVLDRLGITGPPQKGKPWLRLWWCVSGLLSFLPVHAAGHHHTHADAAPATVIDRVISSYTPTIRALIHARRPVTASESGPPGAGNHVVVVAMPHTPGAWDLPGALGEAAWLQQHLPGPVTVLTGSQATQETVLAALPAGQWAHFACHAASDLGSPSASYLLLTDHQRQPLTVLDVARLRLEDAGLAFLSACASARPGARLTDEAIHLASAFQLAGYRHVIATLWPIRDRPAVNFAAVIYTALITTGEGDAAMAVHAAVRQMRERNPLIPSAWASHIHVGT
jgi:hypothetical protein